MEQEVVLDVKVKNQSLKQQLREAVLEAQALQERFGATSTEAINAAKKVANLKEEISDMNDVFKVFSPEQKLNAVIGVAQGIAGGFQAVTGAMQLFGTESKEVEKALLKVQAASAFAEGLNNIRSLGDSFGNLKLLIMDGVRSLGTLKGALIATGVGAFAVAVGAIVTNWKEFVSYIDKTFPALGSIEKLFDRIKKVAFGTLGSIVEGFKVVGEVIGNVFTGEFEKAIDTAGTFGARVSAAYTKGYKEEEQKLADERAALKLEQDIKQHERDLKVIEAQGKDTYALKRKLLNEELELLRLQNKAETEEYKNKLNDIKVLDAEEKRRKDEEAKKKKEEDEKKKKEAADQLQKDFDEAWAMLQKQQDEESKLDENRWEKETQLRLDRQKARILQTQEHSKERLDAEVAAIEEERDILLKNAHLTDDQRFIIQQESNNKIKALNDTFRQGEINSEQAKVEAILQLAQTSLNGLVALAELGIKNEKKLEQAKKIAALVQIGIDTARAISGIVAAASMDPKNALTGGLDIPLKIAAGIVTVLANMAKAKQILSASGSSGSAPSLSTAAIPTSTSATNAGGGVAMQQGPAQQGQTIANANLINNAMNNQNMIRAVVVETDITDSQRRVRGIEDRATFG